MNSRTKPSFAPAEAAFRDQLAAVVEHSNDAIFSRTFDGTITTWNAAAARIFGYAAGEVVGKSSRMLVPAGHQDEFRSLLARLRRGRVVQHFETDRLHRGGTVIRVSLTLSLIRGASGRPIGFSTIARDITEQRRLHDELARRERELNDFFEGASVGLVLVATDRVVTRGNRAFVAMVEAPGDRVVGRSLHDFHPDKAVLSDLFRRLASRETLHNFSSELRTTRGETRFVLLDADGLWVKGCLVHTRWFVRDISRRRQLERELLESADREQRRFAHELHDGLGQQLGGVAYLSSVLRERLAERAAPEAGAAGRIFDLVRKAIEDTRRMARGLSPIREAQEGLMEALRELANQTSEVRGVPCRFVCRGLALVPDVALANHLFRIAQEAVNNALNHARASAIRILLRRTRERILLMVTDDGRGIERLAPDREGMGLRIMRYRAALMRGTLEVAPHLPRGTRVSCIVRCP